MESKALFAQFIHWAIRIHDKSFSEEAWKKNDLEPDTITEGYRGLNLAPKDVVDFIVEHYGDGKDTKRIEGKFKGAKKLHQVPEHVSQELWERIEFFVPGCAAIKTEAKACV